jgi:uncharacterized protein (DUF1501 family)
MKRRSFIKLSSTASALALMPNDIFALFKSAGLSACPNVGAKKIVLVQLAGANDGLNTVVPLNQYDKYAQLRPSIKLNNVGLSNGIFNLDTTLPLQNQVGLHPVLTGFKSLYDKGFMHIVQGVGYPIQDKSHFKSTDLWLTGGDGTKNNNSLQNGWMGRFLESYYPSLVNANFPLGIQLGSSENSLGFQGTSQSGLSLNINGQDPSGFYSIVNGLGGTPPDDVPDSEYGDLLKFIVQNDENTNIYAKSISSAFNSGSNSVTYPNTNLGNQLKSVAKFISGGLETKIYLVKLTGFDTHNSQVDSDTNTHLGSHANLLQQVSDAIQFFITDLNNQNLSDDVVALTFSEFGRKASENGNLGTDHGEIAPMFIFGKSIKPGITGTNINLEEAVASNNFQIQTVQYDYRRVFGTILQDWLGTSNKTLDVSFYDKTNNIGFSQNKITGIIKSSAVVPPSCYNNTLGISELDVNSEVLIYPNPSAEILTINTSQNIRSVKVYALDGKLAGTYNNPIDSNQFQIGVQNLSVGVYTLKIETELATLSKKVIIRR